MNQNQWGNWHGQNRGGRGGRGGFGRDQLCVDNTIPDGFQSNNGSFRGDGSHQRGRGGYNERGLRRPNISR